MCPIGGWPNTWILVPNRHHLATRRHHSLNKPLQNRKDHVMLRKDIEEYEKEAENVKTVEDVERVATLTIVIKLKPFAKLKVIYA